MKKLTNQDYAQALYDVTQEIPETMVSAAVKEFAHLLVRRGKAGSVDDIIHRFIAISEKKEGIMHVDVTTVHGLTEEMRGELCRIVGGKIDILEKKDPAILGGIVVKTHDLILDGSLRTQLMRLKQSIM
jgi:F-type H+-transporting ATPase subunit delta